MTRQQLEQATVPENSKYQRFVSPGEWLPRRAADFLPVCLAVLLWLRLLRTPFVPHGTMATMLDSSWMYCNAYFLKHAFQAGVEYVFPTTLLGYFFTGVYDPALFWQYLAFQAALFGLLAYDLFYLAKCYPDRRARAGFLLACAIIIPFEQSPDVACYMLLIAITRILLDSKDCKTGFLFVNLLALDVLGVMKFTFLIAGIGIAICASLLNKRLQRPRQLNPAGIFTLLFLSFWILLKQPLGNLPAYFKNMAEVSLGYNSGMGRAISADFMVLSISLLIALLLLIWKLRRRASEQNPLSYLMLSLLLVEIWKHGFVRADGHVLIFFGCMAVVPLLLPVYFGALSTLSKGEKAALFACAFLSVFSYLKAGGREGSRAKISWLLHDPVPIAKVMFAPLQVKQDLDAQYHREAARWHLPNIDAYVGRAPVDVISTSQFAAFFNNLNYRPRPVYQSYSAYTSGLLQLNGDFYRGSRAPAYVLVNLYPIDEHWPMLEDSLALQEIWKRYRPVLTEKNFVLFERQADMRAPLSAMRLQSGLPVPIARSRVDFGTEIAVTNPAAWHLLSIHIQPTIAGKLRAIAIRPAPVYIEARLDDGTRIRRRLIPNMAQTDFLLDPYVDDTTDFIQLYQGSARKRVRSFKIDRDPWKPNLWMKPQIEVSVTSIPPLVAYPVTVEQIRLLLDPRFRQEPQE